MRDPSVHLAHRLCAFREHADAKHPRGLQLPSRMKPIDSRATFSCGAEMATDADPHRSV
jgi:hypothetical protein